jgi:transposase
LLEPLIGAPCPPAKVPQRHLRRTISAILWRRTNGAKWRANTGRIGTVVDGRADLHPLRSARGLGTPADVGPAAWRATRDTFLDGSNIRAHQRQQARSKQATAAQRDLREALSRSRGGFGTKTCVIAYGSCRAIGFVLASGEAHELPHGVAPLDQVPRVPNWVVADRGYSSHAFCQHIWGLGSPPAIPTRRNEVRVVYPEWIYNNRNQVERLWPRLEEWRAIATRYEKTATPSWACWPHRRYRLDQTLTESSRSRLLSSTRDLSVFVITSLCALDEAMFDHRTSVREQSARSPFAVDCFKVY